MFRKLTTVGYEAANGLCRFICDDIEDVDDLPTLTSPSTVEPICEPCQAGSTAIVIAKKQEYMLNNQDEWVYYKNLQGGTLIVNDEDGEIEVATLEEIQEYIG